MPNLKRRDFLGAMGAAGTSGLWASQLESATGFAANDTLNIGCIGTGGRCWRLMKSIREIPNTKIVAISDIYLPHVFRAQQEAGGNAQVFRDYAQLLGSKQVDAVVIASPDHWHVPMTVDACDAGKDVYVEKPLTHSLAEGKKVVDAQNANNRIVQVGTQQRSMPQFQQAAEFIRSGKAGKIHKVHLQWNRNRQERIRRTPLNINPNLIDWSAFLGNAKKQPFDEYRYRNWRWFWDFGGGILTDLMVHFIDVAHWIMEWDHPIKATTIGGNYASKGVWETPDTIQCVLEYPDDCQVHFEGTFSNRRRGAMIEFMGTEATVYLDRGRCEIHPEKLEAAPEQFVLGKGRMGRDFYDKPDGELLHLSNWVESVRTRKPAICPAEAGVSSASAAHLGNIAYLSDRVVSWQEANK